MVKRVYKWKPLLTRPLGRPKNRWGDDIRNDTKKLKIKNWISYIQDRNKWKFYVEKHKTFKEWSYGAWRGRRSGCLGLLLRFPVPHILPSITCSRRQSLNKMGPIQSAFLRFTVCRMFFPPSMCKVFTSHTISPTYLLQSSPAPHFETFQSISDLRYTYTEPHRQPG